MNARMKNRSFATRPGVDVIKPFSFVNGNGIQQAAVSEASLFD